jgi:hypothetical protein
MGFPEFPGRREPKAADRQTILQCEQYKGARNSFCASLIHLLKLSGISQSEVFGKSISNAQPQRAYGLCPVLPSAQAVHHESSFAHGIHGFLRVDGYSAGMSSVAFLCSFQNFKFTTRALQKSVAFVIENAKWKCYPFAAFTPI